MVGGVGSSGAKNEYQALVERALETLLKVGIQPFL